MGRLVSVAASQDESRHPPASARPVATVLIIEAPDGRDARGSAAPASVSAAAPPEGAGSHADDAPPARAPFAPAPALARAQRSHASGALHSSF